MKTIGILGGMSWESTARYYYEINEGVKKRLGGFNSAPIILNSVNLSPIEKKQRTGDWGSLAENLVVEALKIQKAGADFLLIASSTMHKVAPELEREIDIPVIHVADATAEVIRRSGIVSAGLLGTQYTMIQSFFRDRLVEKSGAEILVPDNDDIGTIHNIIYQELTQGIIRETSRRAYIEVIERLYARGAETIILGCTEIGLLVKPEDVEVPLVDTTSVHCELAVDLACS